MEEGLLAIAGAALSVSLRDGKRNAAGEPGVAAA
jgi:hypothetical protein